MSVNDFRKIRELGKGKFGTVWLSMYIVDKIDIKALTSCVH